MLSIFGEVNKLNGVPYLKIIENCDFDTESILESSIFKD